MSAPVRVGLWPPAGSVEVSVAQGVAQGVAQAVDRVLASLPVSLARVEADADLVAVAGTDRWPAACADAVRAGVRGVVVHDPSPADVGDLPAVLEQAGAFVVLDGPWTWAPAVGDAAGALRDLDDGERLVELRSDAPRRACGSGDDDRLLLGQLALLRAALAPATGLRVLRRSARGHDALVALGSGSTASLSLVRSDALPPQCTLRVVTARRVVELSVPGPGTAVPGVVRLWDDDGLRTLPTRWESASRVAWRRAHHLLTTGGRSDDLTGFTADAAAVRGA